MDGIAPEIAIKIAVLFKNRDLYSRTGEQVAQRSTERMRGFSAAAAELAPLTSDAAPPR